MLYLFQDKNKKAGGVPAIGGTNLDQTVIILWAVAVVIILAVLLYVVIKRKREKAKNAAKGRRGEAAVAGKLRSICRSKGFALLNNVYLPLYDTTTQLDHIVVGPFGILVVETKADQGEIYGSPKDENWVQVIGDGRNKHYNPLKQNKTHCDNLRHNLKKKNLYVVKIESLVVYAAKNVQLYTTGNAPVVTMKQLKKFFRLPLFRENNNVDVDKVVDTINEIRVKDKRTIAAHVAGVKQMSHGKHPTK